MNISLNWLKEFLTIHQSPAELAETLTNLGLAVDGYADYESIPGGLKGVVVGKIIECHKHPNADRLSLTKVDIGAGDLLHIVCGAPNVAAGQTVLVATIGCTLYTIKGDKIEIKKGKIRGEVSEGMICASDELGLGEDHSGIMVLEDHYSAGTPASDIYKVYTDTIFEVDLTPNRSDATSHMGVAKDLAAYYAIHHPDQGGWIARPDITLDAPSDTRAATIVLEDEKACPRYTGITLTDVTIAESPSWLKDKLKAIGVRAINNVVDITNYILHGYGQPLHAFDLDQVEAGQDLAPVIRVRRLPAGTRFVTLDGIDRTLHQDDLMICNSQAQPLCIAGVFGGLHSGITGKTKNIFLESAHFNASSIRRTSMRQVLRTDAATRYEKGTDPNLTVRAIHEAAHLIMTLAGGKLGSRVIDQYPRVVEPAVINVSPDKVRAVIGQSISDERILQILHALEMQPEMIANDQIRVKVPTNKADVKRDIDVIEEILRIHGFNNVPMPAKMEVSFAISSEASKKQQLVETTASLLCHQGFHEMMGLSLMESRVVTGSGFDTKDLVSINNTSNVHLDVMRPDMLRSGLSALQYNQNRQQSDLKLFEFGKTYLSRPNDSWPFAEQDYLSIFVSGAVSPPHWQLKENKEAFFYLKGLVDQLLRLWGVTKAQFEEVPHPDLDQSQEVKLGSKALLHFGRLSPEMAKKFDLRGEVYYAQVDMLTLWQHLKNLQTEKVVAPGKFPSVRRDLAVIVDKTVRWADISTVLKSIKSNHLKTFDLFDVFEQEERLGKDKKSLAISLIFENPNQTLTENELEKSMALIQDKLREKTGATLR